MNLIDGYKKFKTTKLEDFKNRFKEFENGQAPHTLFVTCSDSRIDPHLITDCKPGELFIVRNAGNHVSNQSAADHEQSVVSTLEYALNILNIKNVIICGHSDCGAVKSANVDLSSTSFLKTYIPNFKVEHDCTIDEAIEVNVKKQIEAIKNFDAFDSSSVTIDGWIYNVSTGGLKVLDNASGDFKEIN